MHLPRDTYYTETDVFAHALDTPVWVFWDTNHENRLSSPLCLTSQADAAEGKVIHLRVKDNNGYAWFCCSTFNNRCHDFLMALRIWILAWLISFHDDATANKAFICQSDWPQDFLNCANRIWKHSKYVSTLERSVNDSQSVSRVVIFYFAGRSFLTAVSFPLSFEVFLILMPCLLFIAGRPADNF